MSEENRAEELRIFAPLFAPIDCSVRGCLSYVEVDLNAGDVANDRYLHDRGWRYADPDRPSWNALVCNRHGRP